MRKSKLITWILVATILVGITGLNIWLRPSILTAEERALQEQARTALAKADETVQKSVEADKLAQAPAPASNAQPAPAPAAAPSQPATAAPPATAPPQESKPMEWPAAAPDTYKVQFECTNGTFVVECTKAWAPVGAQRFYDIVRQGFFDNSGFFRVVPGFMVQFGLAADPTVSGKWRSKQIVDDPVIEGNKKGNITFAKTGAPNSRTTQVFINYKDNAFLDSQGFASFGKVISGMDVVEKINPEYAEMPDQGSITAEGAAYLSKNFPKLDLIKKATLIK